MKPILIDSLYINNSGGLILLKYLTEEARKTSNSFIYLFDKRCEGEFHFIDPSEKYILEACERERKKFYRLHSNEYCCVLCFANVPPPICLNIPVYTYFHNLSVLKTPSNFSFIQKIFFKLKKYYIYLKKDNTDFWAIQTTFSQELLSRELKIKKDKILVLPFFKIHNCQESVSRTDYIYVSVYTPGKNHFILLEAWEKLYEKGIKKTLHLTLPLMPTELKNEFERLIHKGVPLVNHGYISPTELLKIYQKSKATIYPSAIESFGLGIIEAIHYGCDVIGACYPYLLSVCQPSETFDLKADSIVEAVCRYEDGKASPTVCTIKNKIEELLNILIQNVSI